MKPLPPPTARARKLFAALSALAERGINGERDNARKKLERLKARFDWDAPDPAGPDLFAGTFTPRPGFFAPIGTVADMDTASFVKWAIEGRTGIRCEFRGAVVVAEANNNTVRTLETITDTLSAAFSGLWRTFHAAVGLGGDRHLFMRGLFDGMMHEDRRPGEPLPARATPPKRSKREAGKQAPGIAGHPYTIALGLGRQIRLAVPLDKVDRELKEQLKPQIPQTNTDTKPKCGKRLHGFMPPCVLDSGHKGPCTDGFGGYYRHEDTIE